ncbi:MAG: hypothetical protein HOP34_13935, partial [Methylococcaceae bacterium]|nr:hypothetical protein [Methylococcaceae bacterium]
NCSSKRKVFSALKSASPQHRQTDVITISLAHLDILPQMVAQPDKVVVAPAVPGLPIDFKNAVEAFQRQFIQTQLASQQGNKAATAKMLGMGRGNFHRLLKRLAIEATE